MLCFPFPTCLFRFSEYLQAQPRPCLSPSSITYQCTPMPHPPAYNVPVKLISPSHSLTIFSVPPLSPPISLSISLSLCLSLSLSVCPSLTVSLSLCLSLSHTLSHSLPHTHKHTHTIQWCFQSTAYIYTHFHETSGTGCHINKYIKHTNI